MHATSTHGRVGDSDNPMQIHIFRPPKITHNVLSPNGLQDLSCVWLTCCSEQVSIRKQCMRRYWKTIRSISSKLSRACYYIVYSLFRSNYFELMHKVHDLRVKYIIFQSSQLRNGLSTFSDNGTTIQLQCNWICSRLYSQLRIMLTTTHDPTTFVWAESGPLTTFNCAYTGDETLTNTLVKCFAYLIINVHRVVQMPSLSSIEWSIIFSLTSNFPENITCTCWN